MNRTLVFSALLTATLMGAMPTGGIAVSTQVVRDDSFSDFQEGEFEGVALSSDGFLIPSFAREKLGDTGTEIVWDAVRTENGDVICATGHDGKLIRLTESGEPETIGDLDDPELTALAVKKDGTVLIAGSPSGTIFRLGANDELTTHAQIEAKFIWNMTVDEDDNVWAATGIEGKLFRISGDGDDVEVKTAFDAASQNLIDIWINREGAIGEKGLIYIAGQAPGWLYRHRPGDDEGLVLFNAESDEIRSMAAIDEGLVIAVNTERAPDSNVLSMSMRNGAGAETPTLPTPPSSPGGIASSPTSAQAMGDVFAQAKPTTPKKAESKIILLTPDGFTRTLWNADERPIHAIAASTHGRILASAGGNGRLFEIDPKRGSYALVSDARDDYLVNIIPNGSGWLLTAGRNGVVYRMDAARAETGIYRSRIIDAQTPVLWGSFYWRGDSDPDQTIEAAFRKGNSDDPEKGNWEEWSKNARLALGEPADIPDAPARYLQYRLTIQQNGENTDPGRTDYVEAFYRQANRAPRVEEFKISETGSSRSGNSSSGASGSGSSGSSSSGNNGAGGSPAQAGGREPYSNTGQIKLEWKTEDPNGDELVYDLHFKAADETEWKLLKEDHRSNDLTIDVSGVGDGRYRFRVTAYDRPANLPDEALKTQRVSDEYLIDNTSPEIMELEAKAIRSKARITLKAADNLALISNVRADIDNGDVHPLFPTDGFMDEREETFDWMTPELEPGEHVLTISITDRAGNTAVDKVVFNIAP